MKKYRAARVAKFGVPEEVIGVEELERVEKLEPGQARLRMLAAAVNPADLNLLQGTYGVKSDLPFQPGLEGCGEVIESASPRLKAGERVIVVGRVGTWSEEMVVAESDVLPIDRKLDPCQAAMLKVNPQTANRLLRDFVELKSGDWVVQNASNSGVGQCVIQLAKARGVKTLNLVRRPELIEELTKLGATAVVLDDRESLAQWQAVHPRVKPVLACNAVGGDSALRLLSCLAPGATMVTYGAMSRQALKVPNGFLIFKGLQLRGLWVTEWIKHAERDELRQSYRELAELIIDGQLGQTIERTYRLDELPDALQRASESKRAGKIVLDLR